MIQPDQQDGPIARIQAQAAAPVQSDDSANEAQRKAVLIAVVVAVVGGVLYLGAKAWCGRGFRGTGYR